MYSPSLAHGQFLVPLLFSSAENSAADSRIFLRRLCCFFNNSISSVSREGGFIFYTRRPREEKNLRYLFIFRFDSSFLLIFDSQSMTGRENFNQNYMVAFSRLGSFTYRAIWGGRNKAMYIKIKRVVYWNRIEIGRTKSIDRVSTLCSRQTFFVSCASNLFTKHTSASLQIKWHSIGNNRSKGIWHGILLVISF